MMNFFTKKENYKPNSLPVSAFKANHKKYSFSDHLPYSSYRQEEELYYHNDDCLAYCCEIVPRTRTGGSTAVAMNEILNKLPSNMFLQVTYYGSKNLEAYFDAFKAEHSKRGQMGGVDAKIIDDSIDETVKFFREKTQNPCSETMITKLKTIRIFFSIVGNEKTKKTDILQFKRDMYNILHSNGFSPKSVLPETLFKLGFEVLNTDINPKDYPGYDKTRFLNKQVVSHNTSFLVEDDYIKVGDNKTWINMTPQSISTQFHIFEFGQKIGDYLSDSLNSNQFNDNFIINVSVAKKSKKELKKTTRSHSTIATQNWGEIFRKFAGVKKESLDIIDRIDEKKEELYDFDMDVLISGKDYKDALSNSQSIESFWNKSSEGRSKIKLEKTKGIHHLAFLSALPMTMSNEYFYNSGGKFRPLFSNQISHFFPLEADAVGAGTNLPLITRRGCLGAIDLYESSTNFNGYVVATSGAGKSVFLNMLAYNSYARGDRVFILDYDNSFTGLAEAVDGQYLELNPEVKAISFNPFSDIRSREEMQQELPYLSSFIYLLGSSKLMTRADEDEKLIKTELQQLVLSQYDLHKNSLEITHIRDAIIKNNNDSRFTDFAKQLGQYCRGGMYEDWFSGKCEFSMDKDLMGVEFKGVDSHEDLRDPLVMLLLYHIGKVMYSTDAHKPKIQIILDEAHRFLGKNPKMDDFIDQAYRRARKFNASMIIATQGFDDIYSADGGLSKAGKVIVNNSAWKLFLKQTTPSTQMMINANIFGFSKLDEKLLKSIKTRKGEYSEIFTISSDDEKAIFRLIMPRFFYYLTSTDGNDKKLIQTYMDRFKVNKIEAINIIISEEEGKKSA